MATSKLTLSGTTLNVFAECAEGVASYYVDLGTSAKKNAAALSDAMKQVPTIGSGRDFGTVQGAPEPQYYPLLDILSQGINNRRAFTPLELRAAEIRTRTTNNGQKLWVDVVYRSRPRPTIEYDSSLTQRIAETYLNGSERKQMAIDFEVQPGAFGLGIPTEKTKYPKVPVTAPVLMFGASISVSATYYNDELAGKIGPLKEKYSNRINHSDFMFSGDTGKWICSAIKMTSTDGGYSYRIGACATYNPDSWDTIAIYRNPFNQQKVVLEQDVVGKLYATPSGMNAGSVPASYTGNGAGRFAQHFAANLGKLFAAIINEAPLPTSSN